MDQARGSITFIVRLAPEAGGRLRGVVQRVLTREASRFEGDERLVEILRDAVRREAAVAPGTGRNEGPPQSDGEEQA